jgi:hypothetical protein
MRHSVKNIRQRLSPHLHKASPFSLFRYVLKFRTTNTEEIFQTNLHPWSHNVVYFFMVSAFFSFQNGAGYDTPQGNHEVSFWAKVAENPNFSMDIKSDLRISIFLHVGEAKLEAQSLFW